MRILIAGKFYPDSFARCIATTAELMGHTVRAFETEGVNWRRKRIWKVSWTLLETGFPKVEWAWQQRIYKCVKQFCPDLILFPNEGFSPEVIRDMKRATRAKLAIWYPDHLVNLGRQYMLAAEYDAWFFKDPYMADIFRAKLGLNAHYLPEACHSQWHRRTEPSGEALRRYGCDLATAGNMYYYRAKMLEAFKGYDLKIWGNSYPRWLKSPMRASYPGIYVAEEEKARAFNAAKIVINTMHYGEIEGVNCRLFEAAGCGAFQIADWKPALADLFEPEHEIVTFRTLRELKEKIDYYLARPDERREIADRAYIRAHRDHTYEKRLQMMFEVLGLAPAGGPHEVEAAAFSVH
ncbi:MAG TPA: glycosyltransferase [Terriglobia bacterium]|nr:glycosyltransferase [Terriglobia bacterium]